MSNSSEDGHIGTTQGEFSVCQFFKGSATADPNALAYEYTRRFVGAQEAVDAFFHYCQSVGARLGWTARVIITDGSDSITMEWTSGDGITFPAEHAGKLKPGADHDSWGRPRVRQQRPIPDSTAGSGLPDNHDGLHDSNRMESSKEVEARKGPRRGNAADEG